MFMINSKLILLLANMINHEWICRCPERLRKSLPTLNSLQIEAFGRAFCDDLKSQPGKLILCEG
jgi:hypothetical protein